MSHVQRSGRIRRDKFHHDPLPGPITAGAIGLALGADLHRQLLVGIGGQKQIDKARPGDFSTHHQGRCRKVGTKLFGQIARLQAGPFRQNHRQVAGIVAIACLSRPFKLNRDIGRGRQNTLANQ